MAETHAVQAPHAISLRRFPGIRPLAADYAEHFDSVSAFFAGDPRQGDAWRAAIARAQGRQRDRERLKQLLVDGQRRRGAPAAAIAAAGRLADPTSVAIVTGQQAGLFGGPLYTLLKALTALRLAERVRDEHGVPAVAVFWIDAEDHDWDEVASTVVLDTNLQPVTITAPRPSGAGELPVASLALDERIGETMSLLRESLPPTEFTGPLLDELGSAYRPGAGMADAFGAWLERVLGPLGLVLFDSTDTAAKPLSAPVFVHELRYPGRTSQLAARAGQALEALGYHAQVAPHEGPALFHLDPERHAIKGTDGRFVVGDRVFEPAALIGQAQAHPEHFSPNVLLRPIVQDVLFPTVAYVAGPSELAYLGQLGEVYRHFDVPMPLVYPRQSATILDSNASRFVNRYGVALESLQAQNEAELNRLLESQLPPQVETTFQEALRAVEERMAAVIGAVPAVDPTLEGAARSTLGRMEHDLRALHNKMIHAAKRRDETLRRQFTRAQTQAFPHGAPQERSLGFVYFLNRYGPAFVDVLVRDLPLEPGHHWILTP